MNDEQIVKALECCNQEDMCGKCPYDLACYDTNYKSIIAKDALELINRQKAEIEQLKRNFRAAAIDAKLKAKEIERLKNSIDSIVKEMVGESDAT